MRGFLSGFLNAFAILLLLAAAFLGGYWFREYQFRLQHFALLDEAYSILVRNGLKDIPPAPALEYGMIRGMLQAYDEPHTFFVDPPQHELDTNNLEGKFGGIGVQLNRDNGGNWVMFPYPDSPALQAGIIEGDRLLGVDDLVVNSGVTAETIQAAVRGPVDTKVIIHIGRPPDFKPQAFTIQRQEIVIPSVAWHLDTTEPRVGVIKVNLMAASTAGEVQKAVQDLQTRGATHFVLDLRDNPGGYLTAGIDVARLFLQDGIILEEEYRDQKSQTYNVDQPGPLVDIPLVVLINNGSASAAEIVAGALKAYQRAILIGSPSYGKDTIQMVYELSDHSSLHITAAHWWVPELPEKFGGVGIQPNILVEAPADADATDLALQAAVEYFFKP